MEGGVEVELEAALVEAAVALEERAVAADGAGAEGAGDFGGVFRADDHGLPEEVGEGVA